MKRIICTLLAFVLIGMGTEVASASIVTEYIDDRAGMERVESKIIYMDPLELVSEYSIELDDEYSLEVSDYESKGVMVYSLNTEKQYSRSYRIYRTSDNETMVQWRLTGVFAYNGTTSTCEQATMTCNNYQPSIYTVTAKSGYTSGCYAIGNCGAKNVDTGKVFSYTIKFGENPNGEII